MRKTKTILVVGVILSISLVSSALAQERSITFLVSPAPERLETARFSIRLRRTSSPPLELKAEKLLRELPAHDFRHNRE